MLINESVNLPQEKVVEEKLLKAINWGTWETKTYEECFGDKNGG